MSIKIIIEGETTNAVLAEIRRLAQQPGAEARTTAPAVTGGSSTGGEAGKTPDKPKKDTAEKPKKEKPVPQPAPEPDAPELNDDVTKTIDDVKRVVRDFLATFDDNTAGQKAAKALLAERFDGVTQVRHLGEEHYAEAIQCFEDATEERKDGDGE